MASPPIFAVAHRWALSIAVVMVTLAFSALHPNHTNAQVTEPTAAAQEDPVEKAKNSLARWKQVIERVETRLKAKDLSADALEQLRKSATNIQKDLTSERPNLATEVERVKSLINALGPAPKEGEPAEAQDVAAQREELNGRLAETGGALKQLDLLIEKSKAVLSGISGAESIALGNKLLTPTPSLFSPSTWSKAIENAAVVTEDAGLQVERWWSANRVQEAVQSRFIEISAVAIVLAALLGWLIRHWLVRHYGRDPSIENPTYRMRVRAALAEATARTAIPIIVTLAAYGLMQSRGLLFDFVEWVVVGLGLAVITLSVLSGLPRSMLSPAMPQWRLAAMPDETARHWHRYVVILAIVVALDIILAVPAAKLNPSANLSVTYNFIFGIAYALIFLTVAFDRLLWQSSKAMPVDADSDEVPGRSRWWKLARLVIAIMAVTVPVAALSGYGVLSDFIARRMLATTGVIVVALVLHGLARDLVAILTDRSEPGEPQEQTKSPLYVWTVLFLDIGLMLTMAFLIVPLWGGQWANIMDRLGWSLTGFKIGDHVFSLGDVLTGLLSFVIVFFIVRSFQHFMRRRVFQQMNMDSGVRDSLITAIGYVGLVAATVIAIATAGIDLSGLAIVAGALSVGVGFGLQSIVNNFVSGLILLAERPIKVGDWVQVGEHEGIVQRISVRSTEIKTFPRASVIVPNSELISNSVLNWMHKDRTGRVDISVGVGYECDPEQVREILLQCAQEQDGISLKPEPRVIFRDFGDNALLFELRCMIGDVNRRLAVASELRFSIFRAFQDAGISIPYPQRDLHIKELGGLETPSQAQNKKPAKRTTKPAASKTRKPARRRKTPPAKPDED